LPAPPAAATASMDAARQRALLALFGGLINGGNAQGGGGRGGNIHTEQPVARPRRRERADHVHDPPRAVRLQRRAMARSELAADVRRRCSDSRLPSLGAAVHSGAVPAPTSAPASDSASVVAATRGFAPPPPLAALLRRRESSAAAARDARLLTLAGAAFAPNRYLAAFRGGARDRVYNSAFSASGRYLVAAWQDESVRIYDTALAGAFGAAQPPALEEAAAAAAAKVAGGWREAVRVQARGVTWTVSSTDTSPDERSVIYSTLNSTVHLLRLSDPAAGAPEAAPGEEEDDDGDCLEGGSPALPRAGFGGRSLSSLATPRSPYSAAAAAGAVGGGGGGGGGGNGAGERSFRAASGGGAAGVGDFGVSAHEALDFSRAGLGAEGEPAGGRRGRSGFGIFSARFSRGGGEIVAGCNDGFLRIFDIERGVVSESVRAHGDDVNSVCFAGGAGDAADTVISGSDERGTPVKVWDRRALGRPVGALLGHRSGVTHVAPRGDGVHVLSVGKDQTIKLWDRRRAGEASGARATSPSEWQDFDYRWEILEFDRGFHPRDASLLTLHGPAVQQTLVRAHFSPLDSTGGRFVYSGSADGCVYVFDALSGALVRRLRHHRAVVRDVSWHPAQPLLAAASWDGELSLWGFGANEAGEARRQARAWRLDGVGVRARNHAERVRLAAAAAAERGGGGSAGGAGAEDDGVRQIAAVSPDDASSDEDLGADEELLRIAAAGRARGASALGGDAGGEDDEVEGAEEDEDDEEEDGEDEDVEDEEDADEVDE
jgi:WD40 repeat protein